MQKRISNLAFQGTEEQQKKLFEVIDRRKNQQGAVMPILQEAQEIYGYLPIEVQMMVAEPFGYFPGGSVWRFYLSLFNSP